MTRPGDPGYAAAAREEARSRAAFEERQRRAAEHREEAATQAESDGLTGVGILNSDDYSSLNPGYWVVFSGQYDTQSAAQSALSSLTSQVPEAYVRHVVPH